MCWEQGSLQGPALAQAAQAGEADVSNCQEGLPACHPQDCCSTSPHNFKIHLMGMCVCVCLHLYVRPINSLPPPRSSSFPTSYRLPNFYFLSDRSYNLKMQMCGLLWSLMRTPLYCVLTSIRQDYRDRGTLAFGQCHSDSTCCWNARLSQSALSLGFLSSECELISLEITIASLLNPW